MEIILKITIHKEEEMNNKFSKSNIQDAYINTCRHEKREVIISLFEKSDEQGYILAFDEKTLILRNNEQFELCIMKSGIIMIRTVKRSSIIFGNDIRNNGNNSNGSCCFTKYDPITGIEDYNENTKLPKSNNKFRLKDAYKEYVNCSSNFSDNLYLFNDENE